MDQTQPVPPSLYAELRSGWAARARANPLITYGLAATGAVVIGLLIASIVYALRNGHSVHLNYALLGGAAGFATTALGALVGLALGVLLMLGLDYFTPHEHESTGPCGPDCERLNRVWLFVLAIILHNIPEGMAIGVSFSAGDLSVGLPLTSAIAIQDIPEGMAVVLALRVVGMSMFGAVLVAIASGLMEPLGALVGLGISSGFAIAYPVSLGLAAGAMIFVVSHEVIPETHRNGHQTPATIGLMAGFGVMMFLDTALG